MHHGAKVRDGQNNCLTKFCEKNIAKKSHYSSQEGLNKSKIRETYLSVDVERKQPANQNNYKLLLSIQLYRS